MKAWCGSHIRMLHAYYKDICFRNTWSRTKEECEEKDDWAIKNPDAIKRLYEIHSRSECYAIGMDPGSSFQPQQFSLERVP